MKKLSLILLAVVAFALVAKADGFTLSWSANPVADQVTSYKVYEHVGLVYNLLGTVTPPTTTFALGTPAPGVHIYAVSAVNLTGESPKSAEVTLPATPSTPTGVKITNP